MRAPWSPGDNPASRWQDVRLPPRQFAAALLLVGLGGYGAFAIGGAILQVPPPHTPVLIVAVLLVVGLQAAYLSRPHSPPRAPTSYVVLAVQAVLVLVPLVRFGPVWQGFSGFLTASALLVLPRLLALLAVAAVLAVVIPITVAGPIADTYGETYAVVSAVTSTATATIAVYGLTTLTRLVAQAHDARSALERMVVAQERVRLAREVHDLLGDSLSAIALRGELAARLIDQAPERARQELVAVMDTARRAGDDVRRVARVHRELGEVGSTSAPRPGPAVAPRLARWLFVAAVLSFLATAVYRGAVEIGAAAAVWGAALGLLFIVIVLRFVARTNHWLARWRLVGVIVVLAAIAFLPQPLLGPLWYGMPAYLAGVVLAAVPGLTGRLGWLLVLGAGVASAVVRPGRGDLGYDLFYLAVGSVVISVVIFGLLTIPRLVTQVDGARNDIARLAVAQERLRVARDVHDLLGLSVSTIAMKCELAAKLLEPSPARARLELDDVLEAARRSIRDLRTVLAGDGRMSLDDEFRLAESTLTAALVQVRMKRACALPGQPTDAVLATVLREGVTNVLRHSTAKWCDISLHRDTDQVVLGIVNDGVDGGGTATDTNGQARTGGNGLLNMVHRLRVVGGDLTTASDGRLHRLRASVPDQRGEPGAP